MSSAQCIISDENGGSSCLGLSPHCGVALPGPHHRFETLVRPVINDLYGFALRLTRDPVRAEDLLQQSLLVGLRRLDQLRDEGAFRVWQSRIVYRTFLNLGDRQRPTPFDPDDLERRAITPKGALRRPDDHVSAREVGAAVGNALDKLPMEQRDAVWLVDGQGYKYAEAAEILGVPAGTVASRAARGRRALRTRLADVAREHGVLQ